jgi:hypothetical protein
MKLSKIDQEALFNLLTKIKDAGNCDCSVHHSMLVTFICTFNIDDIRVLNTYISELYTAMLKE